MKPAQLFPERRDDPLSRRAERVGGWGGRVGSLYVFLTGLRRRCLLFPQVSGKCAVSITVCLVSAAVAMFLHGGLRVRGELCGLVSPGLSIAK